LLDRYAAWEIPPVLHICLPVMSTYGEGPEGNEFSSITNVTMIHNIKVTYVLRRNRLQPRVIDSEAVPCAAWGLGRYGSNKAKKKALTSS
jgi:hypothetical protein